ncbi:carotenoid oxygenase [Mycotypha africana]|uniref:carotenoid oxygenase n=1 Tax=Mycotypha africana TaxID=64632 RepID=UPI0023001274|nr:carotenoid oxygenase [Mycotypha africana]KAI8979501.1 carotenoid oxygenase [Mycotypha africana]
MPEVVADNHPLETSSMTAQLVDDSTSDTNEALLINEQNDTTTALPSQQESHETQSVVSDVANSAVNTATPVIEQPVDSDVSHAKGFYNTGDSNEVVDLVVEGQLPEWLVGEHYTVGPGTYDVRYTRKIEVDGVLQSATATFTFGHWFDAIPLVNRFDFNGERNSVTYRHRLPNKRLIEKIRDHHGFAPNYPGGLFKTDSNQTVLIKFMDTGKRLKADRVPCGQRILTQLPGVDGRLFCQNFANHVLELDPFDLKPSRIQTWNEINPNFKGYSSCPNGQYDPESGEYINFTMEIGYRSTKYHFFSVTEQEPKGNIIATIWDAPTGWVNNFALTLNYIIMVIHPMLANTGAVKFAWSESVLDSFNFYSSEPTLFYVISRKEKAVIACYRAPASFSLNHVNAFEDMQGNVMVDIVCYENDQIAHQLSTDNLRHPEKMGQLAFSQVRRYTLNRPDMDAHATYLANNSFIPSATSITSRISSVLNYVTGRQSRSSTSSSEDGANSIGNSGWHAWMPVIGFEELIDTTLELPQVNPYYKMRSYSFIYGLGFTPENSIKEGRIWDSIVKIDIHKQSVVASWSEPYCYPSEAHFIPQPVKPGEDKYSVQEDAGVLISIVMDAARSTSFLLVLAATDLQVLARVQLNKLIPISFARGSHKLRNSGV